MTKRNVKQADYNMRLVQRDGKNLLGFVHRLYKDGQGQTWKEVPVGTRKRLAVKLGLELA